MQTFTLNYPVDHDGKTITTIELRRPKVKDMLRAEKARESSGDLGVAVALVAAIADLPVSAIELVDATDFGPIAEAIELFMTRQGPGTAAPLSPMSPMS